MCQYPRQRPSSQPPLPRAQPLNTCSHIATQYQSHYRPYLILNLDVSVEFAQQHASCVDMTILASLHKSRVSTLPTYNINTSDHYTYPIHCHALHNHRNTTTSTTANISHTTTHLSNKSHKQKTTTRFWKMKNIHQKMKSNKSLKDYRTSLTPQYNGAIVIK